MNRYTINGVEIEYDAFDLDNFERYEEEIQRAGQELTRTVKDEKTSDQLRRACHTIKDFFDDVVGTGTSSLLFGEKTNVKECMDAFQDFVNQISAEMLQFKEGIAAKNPPKPNREQRRAAERRK